MMGGGGGWISLTDVLQSDPNTPSNTLNVNPSAFVINPVWRNVVYMATYSRRIYISTDSGTTWTAPIDPAPLSNGNITDLILDPRTAGAINTAVLYLAMTTGLYRSTDGGQSWTSVIANKRVQRVCGSFPANGTANLYASVWDEGVYHSSDGTSWTNLNDGTYLPTRANLGDFQFPLVDYCRKDPNRVYAWFAKENQSTGLYTTSAPKDPLKPWTRVASKNLPNPEQRFYNYNFAVAPNSPADGVNDILFFAGVELKRSVDSGASWVTLLNSEEFHVDYHAFAFYPADYVAGVIPALYVGCDGGIAVSSGYADPKVRLDLAAEKNQDAVYDASSPVFRNLNFGKQSSALYRYASDPSVAALGYLGVQDTGINAGAGSLGWRGLYSGDGGASAVAATANGLILWFRLGAPFKLRVLRDDGGYPVSPDGTWNGTVVDLSSNLVVGTDKKAIGGIFVPGAVPATSVVARIADDGKATAISQDFLGTPPLIVAVHPTMNNRFVCATSEQKVWTSTGQINWAEAITDRPANAQVAAITINGAGRIYVLLLDAVNAPNGVNTPLYRIENGAWIAQPTPGQPGTTEFKFNRIVADPVRTDALYVSHGGLVYRLDLTDENTGQWTFVNISDGGVAFGGLPGGFVYDLWVGNIGTPQAPKVLLRAAIPTRGVWERDVTEKERLDPPIHLYVRDNLLDLAWLERSPTSRPNPYDPGNPGKQIHHYQCVDIKLDLAQRGVPGKADFYQIDPESTNPPGHVVFDMVADQSENIPQATAARVYVQVHNRSRSRANNVNLWLLYCNAAAGVPALNRDGAMNTFDFWSQFDNLGNITPNLPAKSPWHSIGVRTVSGVTSESPQVASFNWQIPQFVNGDRGHYCLAVFLHSAASPIGEKSTSVDEMTPRNRQVGQKNVHLLPPPPPPPSRVVAASWPPAGFRGCREYVEFHNPLGSDRVATLLFDFRGLPVGIRAFVQLTPVDTAYSVARSVTGAIRSGCLAAGETLGGAQPNGAIDCLAVVEAKQACDPDPIPLPSFDSMIYEATPSSLLRVSGVRFSPYGEVAAWIALHVEEPLPAGAEYAFQVQQSVDGVIVGGSQYLLRTAPEDVARPSAAERDEDAASEGESDPLERLSNVPRFAREFVFARLKQLGLIPLDAELPDEA